MTEQQLGFLSCVSIALGGMIGGGIFAVLGVVAQLTGPATWAAFVLAGGVSGCAAYSFNALNRIVDDNGGSVTFVQTFTGNSTLAGMTGWTLLVGYVGSMAMYAFAFGSFAVGLSVVPETVAGMGVRPIVSVLAIGGFVGLNLLGAQATGSTETLLVGLKVGILLVMGLGGLYYGAAHEGLSTGVGRLTQLSLNPIMAAAVSFVAFQGWQLLYYDQESIENATETIRKAVYVAIPSAAALYVIVAITTLSLAPDDVIRSHPERALAVAADPFLPAGFLLISLAALFSTGSAINATLFSSGYLAKGMLSADLLPDRAGDSSASGVPRRTILLLGAITAAFSVLGSLGAITAFASLAFIVVFGAMCAIALDQRDTEAVNPVLPAAGVVTSLLFFVLMFYHLYRSEPGTLVTVLVISVAVIAVELLYFERAVLEEEIVEIEEVVEEAIPSRTGSGKTE
ncbi:APC family permease [Salinarchaeum laminariae]|uniref:APC family permease n=1 Tax=Salinarchaeum laminariae TaxID=869888 RepID=UPI0020C034F9|nr:APC family permease [Salinarchaeum laminariae]